MNMSIILSRLIACLAVTAFSLFVTAPAMARHELPMAGQNGDAGAKAECPAGQALVGFSGLVGLWVDAIQIVCAPPGGQPVAMGPRYGGSGGGRSDSFCPRGFQLFSGYLNMTTHNRQVAAISYSCRSVQTGETTDASFGNPGYVSRCPGIGVGNCASTANYAQQCPSDEVAIGFNVRYGKDVNGFGLICGRVVNGLR
jgi:hypothetical protein